MKTFEISQFSEDIISQIFSGVPYIHQAIEEDPEQKHFFVDNTKILEVSAGDTVIKRGEFDHWVYFLLKGQLLVYPEFHEQRKHLVTHIAPGEIFGEMAIIREFDRNATIMADDNCKKILVLGTDFSAFGKVDDFSAVSLRTKITFYRMATQVIRKRLEILKIEYPENELAVKLYTVRPFLGPKNTLHELLYLCDQAKDFSKLLCKWNRSLEIDSNYKSCKKEISVDIINNITL